VPELASRPAQPTPSHKGAADRGALSMPPTARSVSSRYQAETMDPPASGQPTSTLVAASTDNSHRRLHLPSPE
jgi:hypothetical protein